MAAVVGSTGPDVTEIVVEPMRRRHLRGVLRIEAHNEHRPWSLGLFMSELRQPEGRSYVVAKVGTTVVGFGGELFVDTDAHITTIAVHPDWRRHGIGSRLMLVLADDARRRGVTAWTLEVRASNKAAQALYHRFGLAPVGVRKGYYEDLKEDAVIMWAHDIDTDAYAERLTRIERSITGVEPRGVPTTGEAASGLTATGVTATGVTASGETQSVEA